MTIARRRALPGVSPERAGQLLAGALVADAAMDLLGVEQLEICPWALREGVILRRLDTLERRRLGRRARTRASRLVAWPSSRSRRTAVAGVVRVTPGQGLAVDRFGLPAQLRDDVRAGRPAGLRRGRGDGLDRPGQPGPRRAAPAGRPPRAADRRPARADPAASPSGSGAPTRGPSCGRSCEVAVAAGAGTVVVHPPFRWQRDYARGFAIGVAELESEFGVQVAVENMFPWRARGRELMAYLPHWDPVGQPYEHVTLDLSHTATAGADALAMAEALGDRLVHLHLADGSGSAKDEHLIPGRGGAALRRAAGAAGRPGLGRQRRRRGVDPAGRRPGRAGGRPGRGPGLRPAQPRSPRPLSSADHARGRRGRRPGGEDTRGADRRGGPGAVRRASGTTARRCGRSPARRGWTPALVHHYFEGKAGAVRGGPRDAGRPARHRRTILAGGPDGVGERLARFFFLVWDGPEGRERIGALLRAAASHDDAARMLREFVTREIFGRVVAERRHAGRRPAGRARRVADDRYRVAALRHRAASPWPSAPVEDLVARLAPTLQAYLAD